LEGENIKVIKWTEKISKLLDKSDLIISEAGYFTMLDLLLTKTPAIMIPGKRGIDNQELRAVNFELLGIGKIHFPFQEKYKLKRMVSKFVEDKSFAAKYSLSREKVLEKVFAGKSVVDCLLQELK